MVRVVVLMLLLRDAEQRVMVNLGLFGMWKLNLNWIEERDDEDSIGGELELWLADGSKLVKMIKRKDDEIST